MCSSQRPISDCMAGLMQNMLTWQGLSMNWPTMVSHSVAAAPATAPQTSSSTATSGSCPASTGDCWLHRRTGDGGRRGCRPDYSWHNGHTGCGGAHGSSGWECSGSTAITDCSPTPAYRRDSGGLHASSNSEYLGQPKPVGWRLSTMAAGTRASGSCPTPRCHSVLQVGTKTLSPHGKPQLPGHALPYQFGTHDSPGRSQWHTPTGPAQRN